MAKYYIEQINTYNKRISLYNLILKKIKWKWKIVFSIFMLLLIILASIAFIEDTFRYVYIFITIILVLITNILLKNEQKRVVKKHYSYALNSNGSYIPYFLLEIQKRELINLLGDELFTKEILLFLIEKLSSSSKKYSYIFSRGAISVFLAILSGAFFSKFLDFATDMHDFLNASKVLIPIGVLYTALAIIIDIFVIKEFVTDYFKNKNRLIRTLENIYLEKFILF